MTDRIAKLEIDGTSYEFPIISGSTGPDVIDIRSLYAKTGHFTFDPGYTSTGSTESAITYIDGDKGTLLYRGYPIEQLADKSSFLEVAYLLLKGELPSHRPRATYNCFTPFDRENPNDCCLGVQVFYWSAIRVTTQ